MSPENPKDEMLRLSVCMLMLLITYVIWNSLYKFMSCMWYYLQPDLHLRVLLPVLAIFLNVFARALALPVQHFLVIGVHYTLYPVFTLSAFFSFF